MPLETLPIALWDGALFNDVNAFLILMIIVSAVIGLTSGHASIGAYGAFIVFVRIATETDLWIFNSLLYVVLAIVFVVMGIQAWGYVQSPAGGDA